MDKTSNFLKAVVGIVAFVWLVRSALLLESTFEMVLWLLFLGFGFAFPAYWLYNQLALMMTGERYNVKFDSDRDDTSVILIDRETTDRKEVSVNEDGSGYYFGHGYQFRLWDDQQKALDAFLKKNADEFQRRKDVDAETIRKMIAGRQAGRQ